jgi:hypothetical protein
MCGTQVSITQRQLKVDGLMQALSSRGHSALGCNLGCVFDRMMASSVGMKKWAMMVQYYLREATPRLPSDGVAP